VTRGYGSGMPGYDWALMADQGGEAIESLVATFLTRRYPTARQTNPSQGDGGVDVVLETPEGIEVWQVKKFTRPLGSGQWRHVRQSWERFGQEYVAKGVPVVRYHLVTPWTPTEERYEEFKKLTEQASFPAQWDGEAFLNGLADDYPATLHRFRYGAGAFEQYVNSKALIAASPVEGADGKTMLEAIEVRQGALDELRDSISDNYRVERGTRTVRGAVHPPMPDPADEALMYRMSYLGDDRWRTEAVVPLRADAQAVEPIELDAVFKVEEGSAEHAAVVAWYEWGIPFKDIPTSSLTRGGPFGDTERKDTFMSFVPVATDAAPLFCVLRDKDGNVKLRMPLTVIERTQGARTGWLRLIAETPQHLLRFELRVKGLRDYEVSGGVGNVDGLDPQQVLAELDQLQTIGDSDHMAVEIQNGGKLFGAEHVRLPAVLEKYFRPVATGLAALQASTTQALLMPDVLETTEGELRTLARYVSIYSGTPVEWKWSTAELPVPHDQRHAETFLRDLLPALMRGDRTPVVLEQPSFVLADRRYLIERPLVTTRRTYRIDPGIDIEALKPGDTVRLEAGDDDTVVTAAVVDWTPGSIDFSNDPDAPAVLSVSQENDQGFATTGFNVGLNDQFPTSRLASHGTTRERERPGSPGASLNDLARDASRRCAP